MLIKMIRVVIFSKGLIMLGILELLIIGLKCLICQGCLILRGKKEGERGVTANIYSKNEGGL